MDQLEPVGILGSFEVRKASRVLIPNEAPPPLPCSHLHKRVKALAPALVNPHE